MPPKKKGAGKKKAAAKGKPKKDKGSKIEKKVPAKDTDKAGAATASSTRIETAEGSHVTTTVTAAATATTSDPVSASAPTPTTSQPAAEEVLLPPVDMVADPWAGVGVEEQWRCVVEEEGNIVAGECGDEIAALVDSAVTPVWLKLNECELETFQLDDKVLSQVIALDLSNNSLSEGIHAPEGKSLPANCAWLRFLSLQANPLPKCPDFKPYGHCLLWLDLSFVETCFQASDFIPLAGSLRHLTMDSCDLGSSNGLLSGDVGDSAGVPLFR